ncbi:MAG: DUF5915 domain-containing protein [Christensenellales bacterium]
MNIVNDQPLYLLQRKPQIRTLGPHYGRLLGRDKPYLAQDGIRDKVVDAHKGGGGYAFELSGAVIELKESDLLITAGEREGYGSVIRRRETAVVLDTFDRRTDSEGYVRELVCKIQIMRKEEGFEVTDRIALTSMRA